MSAGDRIRPTQCPMLISCSPGTRTCKVHSLQRHTLKTVPCRTSCGRKRLTRSAAWLWRWGPTSRSSPRPSSKCALLQVSSSTRWVLTPAADTVEPHACRPPWWLAELRTRSLRRRSDGRANAAFSACGWCFLRICLDHARHVQCMARHKIKHERFTRLVAKMLRAAPPSR